MSAAIQSIASHNLSPAQEQVISHLSSGNSFSVAAEAAGVHRNTILNWRRSVPAFSSEFERAAREQAQAWQEEAMNAVPLATQTITAVLNDPAAPIALRLRAAGMILKMADLKTAAAPERQTLIAIERGVVTVPAEPAPYPERHEAKLTALQAEIQAARAELQARRSRFESEKPEILHNSAQSPALTKPQTFHRETPKVGRNEPCPCGSGRKYKICCLNRPESSVGTRAV
jgi:uncharacterized protein YchJ